MPDRPSTIGRFRILRTLGAGGMGVVYAAYDDRLEREIAVKTIPHRDVDDGSRERFLREARVAASVNHPNICQVYEVGEEEGRGFLAMELLEGEPLSAKLQRGALDAAEAAGITLALLSALAALHQRGVVHRDVKPSNIFLTPHGVKLLDFGVASRCASEADPDATALTARGAVVGTPHYMAPEQALGHAVDARTDVFAAGLVLFEMLTGRQAFPGDSTLGVLHAIAYDPAPAIDVSSAAAALNPIVRRALAKRAEERYPNSPAMAADLTAAMRDSARPRPTTLTRLIVLPFRILRSDPSTDFLAFSLPDAITTTLSAVKSLAVRSSLTAARFKGAVDLKQIAVEADVNIVLTGTFLNAGDRLRVTTQLVEVPAETVVWSDTADVPVGDVFQLQDELTRRIVDSLSLPLTADERRQLRHDVPATAAAYDLYLRANQLSQESSSWAAARDLYRQSLHEDDRYAPAWARLARSERLLAKYGPDHGDAPFAHAEDALQRAFALNPELPLAHYVQAQIDVDRGRAEEAMVRLLGRARQHGADAEIFAALVHTCRYCGLMDASLAAHARALSLDSSVETSVMHTHFLLRRYADVIATSHVVQAYVFLISLGLLGRSEEALEWTRTLEAKGSRIPVLTAAARTLLEGRGRDSIDSLRDFAATFRDPEGVYYIARHLSHVGEPGLALPLLRRAVDGGYFCYPAMAADPWLDALRDDPAFRAVVMTAKVRCDHAAARFASLGGPTLLG